MAHNEKKRGNVVVTHKGKERRNFCGSFVGDHKKKRRGNFCGNFVAAHKEKRRKNFCGSLVVAHNEKKAEISMEILLHIFPKLVLFFNT